jgi:mannose-6-phosphate isomerase-like protein (cupin superfamily)
MHAIHLSQCEEFISGDWATLRELLHPDKAAFELRFSLAHAIVKSRTTTSPHILKTSEVYYILSGKGEMHINEEMEEIHPGTAVYIPPHAIQYIQNPGEEDLVFLCIVDPAWREEDEEMIKDKAIER